MPVPTPSVPRRRWATSLIVASAAVALGTAPLGVTAAAAVPGRSPAADLPTTCDQALTEQSDAVEPYLPGWGIHVSVTPCHAPLDATIHVEGDNCPGGSTVRIGGNPGGFEEEGFPFAVAPSGDGSWSIDVTPAELWGPTPLKSNYVFEDGLALWAACVPADGHLSLGSPFGVAPFVEAPDGVGDGSSTTTTPTTTAPTTVSTTTTSTASSTTASTGSSTTVPGEHGVAEPPSATPRFTG